MEAQKLKHISIGKDGSVWAVRQTDDNIMRLYGDAGFVGWVPDRVGKAAVITAVDWGQAWCINKDHEIWHLTDAESLDHGGTWTNVPSYSGQADAQTISVGNDGTVWYAQTDGTIIRQAQPSDGTGLGFWLADSVGKATTLAVIDATSAWCVNRAHQLWFWQNGTWTQIPTLSGQDDAQTVAVDRTGRAWYGNTKGEIFASVQPGSGVGLPPWQQDTTWHLKKMGPTVVISIYHEDVIWVLTQRGEAWSAYNGKWEKFAERVPDGIMWTYKVKPGDGLLAIVRREFQLSDAQDTAEINRFVKLIVAQNNLQNPDRIKIGAVLTLRY